MREHGSGLLVPDGGIWAPAPNVELRLYRGLAEEDESNLLDVILVKNAQTAGFRNMITDQLLAAPTLGKTTHMAVGTGAPAANALGAESARVALTKTKTGGTNTAVVRHSADFPPGTATAALTEAGTFDAASVGNMHFNVAFSVINKDAGMDLVINWDFTQS